MFKCAMVDVDVVTYVNTNCCVTAQAAITAWKTVCKTLATQETSVPSKVVKVVDKPLPAKVNSQWYQMALSFEADAKNTIVHMWILQRRRGHDTFVLMQSVQGLSPFQYDADDLKLDEFKELCKCVETAQVSMTEQDLERIVDLLRLPTKYVFNGAVAKPCTFRCIIHDFSG